jgi:hypothetical protein
VIYFRAWGPARRGTGPWPESKETAVTTTAHDEPRPGSVHEEHLVYLDDLRESGVTNMFGARR